MPLDRNHITVQILERLLPEAIIAGGSFGLDLRHPSQIPRDERRKVFESAQRRAVNECIRNLCERAGLSEGVEIQRGPRGEPLWPNGFVGSITHKGIVVLAALAPKPVLRALGIDVELIDTSQLGAIEKNVATEGLPPSAEGSLGVLLAFSAKEAVFKAQYPLTSELLGFSDITIRWRYETGGIFFAQADCGNTPGFQVKCTIANPWVVSTAIMPTETQGR